MVDIDAAAQIVAVVVYRPKAQLLLASNVGRGFVADMDELLAETRKGRGVVSTKPGVRLAVVREIPPEHDHVAVVGDNRKLVIFSLAEMPVMAKGQGVALQRYRDGGLSDAVTLRLEDGLSWKMGGDSGRNPHRERPVAVEGGPRRRRPDAPERLPARQQVLTGFHGRYAVIVFAQRRGGAEVLCARRSHF